MKRLLNKQAMEVKVMSESGNEYIVKQATFSKEISGENKPNKAKMAEARRAGKNYFYNVKAGKWYTGIITEIKVDGEWKEYSEMKRMSLEQATSILESTVGATVEVFKGRKSESDPRYLVKQDNCVIPFKTGYEIVAKAKRILEAKQFFELAV